ncbi:type VI secretion system-associated protein TagO [Celeribacter sp.]|uniref:type VI secretion system-associated protein TagO n=1 Tax=Celeribacter sp. TaxID=1890673 RepID=UPI003A8DFBAB
MKPTLSPTAAVALALSASLITPAHAQDECAAIADDSVRLACFDAAHNGESTYSVQSDKYGLWRVEFETSAATGETDVFLKLDSSNDIPGMWEGDHPATLVLRCMDYTTAAYFGLTGHTMTDAQNKIEFIIDYDEVWGMSTLASTSHTSLGLWSDQSAIPFIELLIGHDSLIASLTPTGESPVKAEFEITGLDNAIHHLRDACDW